jgi:MarR family transcriptional regulator, organic hydroperoxide resistance regulator
MTPAEELRYLVLALQREGNRQLAEVLRPLGLTPSQAEVLQVLDQFGELTLIELGERLVCETGSPSRLVNGMVNTGYILKALDPNDGRAIRLKLSSQGVAMMPSLNAIEDAYNRAVAEQARHLPVALDVALNMLHTLVEGTAAGRAVKLRKAKPNA